MAAPIQFANPDDPAWDCLFGGPGGVPFDDSLVCGDQIEAIWLASGSLIDSVQIAYRNGRRTSRHGGIGGTGKWVNFEPGESMLSISGYFNRYVCFLSVRTDRRVIEAGHPVLSGQAFSRKAPDGYHLIGLHGRCGHYLDAVGVRIAPLPPPPHDPLDLARAQLSQMGPVRFTSDGRARGARRWQDRSF